MLSLLKDGGNWHPSFRIYGLGFSQSSDGMNYFTQVRLTPYIKENLVVPSCTPNGLWDGQAAALMHNLVATKTAMV